MPPRERSRIRIKVLASPPCLSGNMGVPSHAPHCGLQEAAAMSKSNKAQPSAS
jgi:hypothetical protein